MGWDDFNHPSMFLFEKTDLVFSGRLDHSPTILSCHYLEIPFEKFSIKPVPTPFPGLNGIDNFGSFGGVSNVFSLLSIWIKEEQKEKEGKEKEKKLGSSFHL